LALLSGLGVPVVLSRCGGNCGSCGNCAPLFASIPVMLMVLGWRRAGARLVAACRWPRSPPSQDAPSRASPLTAADESVKPVADTIDTTISKALATRAAGEVVAAKP
jgi:hypothetical protein